MALRNETFAALQQTTRDLINREIMQQLWDVDPVELFFLDRIERQSVATHAPEWAEDPLNTISTSNKFVDGESFASKTNKITQGQNVGNYVQQSEQTILISWMRQEIDTVAQLGKMSYQVMRRQQDLWRDIEAACLFDNASVEDNGDATAGQSGSYFAWCKTNTSIGGGAGANGGYNTTTKVVDAPTAGTTRALSMAYIDGVMDDIYGQGGIGVDCLITVPDLKSKISTHLLDSANSRVATIYTDTTNRAGSVTAKGSISVYESDHGTLDLLSSPIMQPKVATPGSRNVYVAVANTDYWALGTAYGPVVRELPFDGAADKAAVVCGWTLKALNERASGAVRDINDESDVTA